MIIVPNRIKLPDYVTKLKLSSTRNYLIKYELYHNLRNVMVNLQSLEIPFAIKTRSSSYSYFGYNEDLQYVEIHVSTKASTESLDAFFKEQGERYCQSKLMKTLS